MVTSEKTYTWESFEAFAASHPDALLELIDGRIVEKVTSELHGKIVGLILFAFINYLKNHPNIKGHWSTEASYRPENDDKNVRRPDVSLRLTDETVSNEGTYAGIPHVCVEVKSPGNTYEELRGKAQFYISNGAKLVWLVYPAKELVEVYFADGTSEFFLKEDTLNGGEVLPDFSLPVVEIFDV